MLPVDQINIASDTMKYSGLKMSPAKFFKIVRLTETNKIHIWMLPLQSNHTAAPCGIQTLII